MHRTITTKALICFLFFSPTVGAFTFFNAYNASISQLTLDTYQFHVSVDYNFEMKTEYDGTPATGAFCGFSLGQLYGASQSNFAPYSDKPGQSVWYSDSWWHTDQFGFYPSSLPGIDFGYDFSYAGDVTQMSSCHFAAQAMWAWSDSYTGEMHYDSEFFEGDLTPALPNPANPTALPEAPSVILLAVGLVGVVVTRRSHF